MTLSFFVFEKFWEVFEMKKIEAEFEIEKETKNTIRYEEVTEGRPPAIRTIYIQKWALGKNPPKKIKVTIEEV